MKNHRGTSQDSIHAKSSEGSNSYSPSIGAEPRRKRGVPLTPESALQTIRRQLGEGRYRAAQTLAQDAAARFPEHLGVGRMHRALNKRTVQGRPATGRDTTEEFRWLKNPPNSSRGKWVALVGDQVVAASESVKELMKTLGSKELLTSPLVVRVD